MPQNWLCYKREGALDETEEFESIVSVDVGMVDCDLHSTWDDVRGDGSVSSTTVGAAMAVTTFETCLGVVVVMRDEVGCTGSSCVVAP